MPHAREHRLDGALAIQYGLRTDDSENTWHEEVCGGGDNRVINRPTEEVSPEARHIWSRREELNTPSAEYNSAALPLSYTGLKTRRPTRAHVTTDLDERRGEHSHRAPMQIQPRRERAFE